MFLNSTGSKSALVVKRQGFKALIRREYLQNLFASKRKQKLQKDISQKQKQLYLQQIDAILRQYFSSQSRQSAQHLIQKLHYSLTRQKSRPKWAIIEYGDKIIKTFIMFPHNRYSILILYIMINNFYEYTFDIDDKKFQVQYQTNMYEVKLERKNMTQYQQAIDVLLKTIDQKIQILSERKQLENSNQQQSQYEMIQYNKKSQNKLKIYLSAIKLLAINFNSFLIRYEYVYAYMTKWCKYLLLDFNYGKTQLLMYLNVASRFVVPFKSLCSNSSEVSVEMAQIQHQIIQKLFAQCSPQQGYSMSDRKPLCAMLSIQAIFSYQEIKIQILIKYFPRILQFIRVIFCNSKYFKMQTFHRIFQLLIAIVNNFILKQTNVDTPLHIRKAMRQINIVQLLKQFQLLNTFDLYIKTQSYLSYYIFQTINYLLDYILTFDYDIDIILRCKDIFPQICHRIQSQRREIVKSNLKCVNIICEYAVRNNKKHYFSQMINYSVDTSLERLLYHMDDSIKYLAQNLFQSYFTEDQVYQYTQLNYQLKRYQNQNEFIIPERNDVYDY